jgi:formylglycine-generating enzyme required for sulfatase activity
MKNAPTAHPSSSVDEAENELRLPDGVPPVLGDYRLVRFINDSPHMNMYEAVQQSVERRVVLQLLKPEACANPDLREEFKQLARAKANLVHPNVAPVYELLQSETTLFYTGALLPGKNLDQLASAGRMLTTEQVLQIMITVGESMVAIKALGVAHRPLKGTDIHLDDKDQAHMANLALPPDDANASRNEGIGLRKFILSLSKIAPRGIAGDLLGSLIEISSQRTLDWAEMLSETRLAGRSYNIGRANRLARARGLATSFLKRRHSKRRIAALTLFLGALAALITFSTKLPVPGNNKARSFDSMVRIPGGSVVSDGRATHIPSFWIDQHEVTIGQYARFLAAIEKTGSNAHDHADQPDDKQGHAPPDWQIILQRATKGSTYKGQAIDLNCPVFLVDWWDAYAYADWLGRRLPTSEEWRKAASVRPDKPYPWGDTRPGTRANLGADYNPESSGGALDGFNYWAPVDAHPEDISAFEAVGMAGNVEEWTATWVNHPDYPDRQTPVVCGASFASVRARDLNQTKRAASPEDTLMTRGFRTASSTPPPDEGT